MSVRQVCTAVVRANCVTTSPDPTAVTASPASRGMHSAGPALVWDTGVWDPLGTKSLPLCTPPALWPGPPQMAVPKLPPLLLAQIPCCSPLTALSSCASALCYIPCCLPTLCLLLIVSLADVNECWISPGRLCQHTCENTPGSYRCSCAAGFLLAADGKHCEGTAHPNF